jgi:hypothetical protein
MNTKDIAVYRIDDDGRNIITVGKVELYVDGRGEVECTVKDTVGEVFDVSSMGPEEQGELLREYGFTHVFCDTYYDRCLFTVEEYVERLVELE